MRHFRSQHVSSIIIYLTTLTHRAFILMVPRQFKYLKPLISSKYVSLKVHRVHSALKFKIELTRTSPFPALHLLGQNFCILWNFVLDGSLLVRIFCCNTNYDFFSSIWFFHILWKYGSKLGALTFRRKICTVSLRSSVESALYQKNFFVRLMPKIFSLSLFGHLSITT